MLINSRIKTSGEAQLVVHNEKGEQVSDSGWIRNLLTNRIMENGGVVNVSNPTAYFLENASTPILNKYPLTQTFTQVGKVVTASSDIFNNGLFSIGDQLKFAGGKRAMIDTIDSPTQVTVFEEQAIAVGETAIHYRTGWDNQLGFSGEVRMTQSCNMPLQTHTVTPTGATERFYEGTTAQVTQAWEIDVVNITGWSRIIFPETISLLPGNTVTFRWRVKVEIENLTQTYYDDDLSAVGFPWQFNITDITSDGTKITINTERDIAWLPGDSIKIQNADTVKFNTTSITSDGSKWTVVCAGHPFVNGDDVTLISTTGNYNGDYIVANVIDANTFEITNGASHAVDSGSSQLTIPAVWYNGIHTVSAVPNSTTVEILSTETIPPSIATGTIGIENSNYTLNLWGDFAKSGAYAANAWWRSSTEVIQAPRPVYGEDFRTTTGFTSISTANVLNIAPRKENGWVRYLSRKTAVSASNEFPRVKQLWLRLTATNFAQLLITFDHVQHKPNTVDWTLWYRIEYRQDLP